MCPLEAGFAYISFDKRGSKVETVLLVINYFFASNYVKHAGSVFELPR